MDKMNLDKEIDSIISKVIRESLTEVINESNEDKQFVLKIYTTQNDKDFVGRNADVWWAFLQEAYGEKNGYKGLRKAKDFTNKNLLFKIVYYNKKMVSLAVYNPYIVGNKCVGIASIQGEYHKHGIVGVKMILCDDVVNWQDYFWIEVDSVVETYCQEVGSYNLPSIYAKEILPFNITLCEDEFHYTRLLDGQLYTKTVFGMPNKETYDKVVNERYGDFQSFIDNIENTALKMDYTKLKTGSVVKTQQLDIDTSKKIIYAFCHHTFEQGVYSYPQSLIDKLKSHIDNIKNSLKYVDFEHKKKNIYISAIEDGEELLSLITPIEIEL